MNKGRKEKKSEKRNPPPGYKPEEEDQFLSGGDLLGKIDQLLKEAEAEINKKKPKGWEDKGTCNC